METRYAIQINKGSSQLEGFVPAGILPKDLHLDKKTVPGLAKDLVKSASLEAAARRLPSRHLLALGDSRTVLAGVPSESIHLVVTSPPYWTLKDYLPRNGQMGHIQDYEEFVRELDRVWAECMRLLVPGGRMAVVVGDVCLPRRKAGRHLVYPLHASIQEHCRALGFDNLSPIFWRKISNAQYEAGGGGLLGKPYEPNGVLKNEVEFILLQRKPGGYRTPEPAQRLLSIIPEPLHKAWFTQVWDIHGASTKDHPAPYPLPLAERLVRMFSFAGDTVLDPFVGSGTTSEAAALWGRNSIGVDVEPSYLHMARARLEALPGAFGSKDTLSS